MLTSEDPDMGRFRYIGREFQIEIGLQYNRARYYDPEIGRWISEDPIGFRGGDTNLYRYASNTPNTLKDPYGLDSSPEQRLGYDVEDVICDAYTRSHRRNRAMITCGKAAHLGGIAELAKPDILNHAAHRYIEIKPLSFSGVAKGVAQLILRHK